MNDLMEHALSHKSSGKPHKAAKKTVRHMHITKAHSGGYMIKHIHDNPVMHPDEDHVAPDADALQDHIEEHMGEPEGEGAPAQGAAPQPGAPNEAE